MALKAILLRKKLEGLRARMEGLTAKTQEHQAREAELAEALNEAATDEDIAAVEGLIEEFEQQRTAHQGEVDTLQGEIDQAEEELRTVEAAQPESPVAPNNNGPVAGQRKDESTMEINQRGGLPLTVEQRAYRGLTMEQRAAMLAREDVKEFLARARELLKEKRSVTGAELMIPTVMLDLIRQNIEDYSKLIRRVRFVQLKGRARQVIMGAIPEAVWTEMCAALNELFFSANMVELDGYKVGGYVAVCNATLEDTDGALMAELIVGIGASIGIGVDKSIVFGLGKKMPLGIATRLAQKTAPSDYPAKARPWVDLSQSNVITIPAGTTGLALFQAIATAAGNAKGKYSRGEKFWAMNETTYTALQVAAMSINAAGAIVSAQQGTMPVIGGDVVVFGDEIMPANTIVGGYGDLYLLAEREGTSIESSEHARFTQDQTVVKGSARYDGTPVIPEGFVAIGIGAAPVMTMPFAPDAANPAIAALAGLMVGGLTLAPTFSSGTKAYTTTTTNASDVISAIPAVGGTVELSVGGSELNNGAAVTWAEGANEVSVKVTNGDQSDTYTVTVTKSAAKAAAKSGGKA